MVATQSRQVKKKLHLKGMKAMKAMKAMWWLQRQTNLTIHHCLCLTMAISLTDKELQSRHTLQGPPAERSHPSCWIPLFQRRASMSASDLPSSFLEPLGRNLIWIAATASIIHIEGIICHGKFMVQLFSDESIAFVLCLRIRSVLGGFSEILGQSVTPIFLLFHQKHTFSGKPR